MYKVTKFYQGRFLSLVDGVDHDRLVTMIFEEMLPEVKANPDYSFVVGGSRIGTEPPRG